MSFNDLTYQFIYFSSIPFIIMHLYPSSFPSFVSSVSLTACEKNVQKVCANSSEENLQPFKEKMAGFVSAGESKCFICGKTAHTKTVWKHKLFASYKYVFFFPFHYFTKFTEKLTAKT